MTRKRKKQIAKSPFHRNRVGSTMKSRTLILQKEYMVQAGDLCGQTEDHQFSHNSWPQVWNSEVFTMSISQSDITKTKWKYTLKRKCLISHIKLLPFPISYIALLKQLINIKVILIAYCVMQEKNEQNNKYTYIWVFFYRHIKFLL